MVHFREGKKEKTAHIAVIYSAVRDVLKLETALLEVNPPPQVPHCAVESHPVADSCLEEGKSIRWCEEAILNPPPHPNPTKTHILKHKHPFPSSTSSLDLKTEDRGF